MDLIDQIELLRVLSVYSLADILNFALKKFLFFQKSFVFLI